MAKDNKPMSKSQLISELAESSDLSKKQIVVVMDNLMALAYKEAPKGFSFPGLGKLLLKDRKKRNGRNPATGESIVIPAKKVLKFRIAKAAKDAILPKTKKK